jgi:predicted amino acid-binding ACT domain protein
VKSFILLVSCPDQPGIVARITGSLYEAGCNILALEQHVEDGELFFMRIEADIVESRWPLGELRRRLGELVGDLKAEFALADRDIRPRLGVLVSQQAAAPAGPASWIPCPTAFLDLPIELRSGWVDGGHAGGGEVFQVFGGDELRQGPRAAA